MKLSGLYIITDTALCPGRNHREIVEAAIDGGAGILQLRDKTASDRDFYNAALECREITNKAGALFFVNDRIHIAAAVGADGVNVGQNDLPVDAVRKVLGSDAIIGVSADNIDQAIAAERDGADYVGFGPVFSTSTKLDAGPVSGLTNLKRVCADVGIPVVAIGGIGPGNICEVAKTGAACAAVVSAVVCAEDMAAATADLISRFGRKG